MKNSKTRMSTAGKILLFAALLIIYAILSYLYPMSQDDYEFAGKYLGETFRGFAEVIKYFGNGRYLGNGIVLFLRLARAEPITVPLATFSRLHCVHF